MELYIHIPFCKQKCNYCDFLSWNGEAKQREEYVQALLKEITAVKEKKEITSIFIGGGTPSILEPQQMKRIMEGIHEKFKLREDAEITIEANPGTITREKLEAYRTCGINRISFGLQSIHEDELKLLGRIHTFKEFEESYHMARQTGFQNINIDLIMAVPNQTMDRWKETLQTITSLKPEHISAYSLIIEEGTPFYEMDYEFSEDLEREMYEETKNYLKKQDYQQYEISNFARPGYSCRHNLGYWDREEYLGLGLGAASLIDEQRWNNTRDILAYLSYANEPEKIRINQEVLMEREQMEEFMFLGLRKTAGVSVKKFQEKFGDDIKTVYGRQLEKLTRDGLLEYDEHRVWLTERGISVSNYAMAEFLFDDE